MAEEVKEAEVHWWSHYGGAELEAVLASRAIALLDAHYLIEVGEAGGVLLPRQLLPEEAFVDLPTLQRMEHTSVGLPVVAVSQPWLQRDHPDPLGFNLKQIARGLGALLEHTGYATLGVFIDFGSLYQACRDKDKEAHERTFAREADGRFVEGAVGFLDWEKAAFLKGVNSMSTIYSHPHTWVLLLTNMPPDHATAYDESRNLAGYDERGWCWAESASATLVKDAHKMLNLARFPADGRERLGRTPLQQCMIRRRAPMAPRVFVEQLATKMFTDKSNDFEIVATMYTDSLKVRYREVTTLRFTRLNWHDADVEQLAAVLEVVETPQLSSLDLTWNLIRPEGAAALAAVFGHIPQLATLWLSHNWLFEEGVVVVADALAAGNAPNLERLYLGDNHTNPREGLTVATAVAGALPCVPKLVILDLTGLGMGPDGIAVLAAALPNVPQLVNLSLAKNQMGDDGVVALVEVFPSLPELGSLWLEENEITDAGAAALAAALPALAQLVQLLLAETTVLTAGAAALEAVRPQMEKLKMLRIDVIPRPAGDA